ncbi:hypothetical protein JXA88_16455 [Candidatus Fermentibacteria bacterium]|nr:hypothetical protein [Candidatus Fermentibacteria bacterium]
MMADSVTVVLLKLKNTSSCDWPKDGPFKLGYRWQDEKGNEIEKLGGRARPQKDVPAGQMAFFKARVNAPATPGTYYLVWDMVEEQVTWFSKKGASPVKVAVAVR